MLSFPLTHPTQGYGTCYPHFVILISLPYHFPSFSALLPHHFTHPPTQPHGRCPSSHCLTNLSTPYQNLWLKIIINISTINCAYLAIPSIQLNVSWYKTKGLFQTRLYELINKFKLIDSIFTISILRMREIYCI